MEAAMEKQRPPQQFKDRVYRFLGRYKLREDYRARLPDYLSRFTGYRRPGTQLPYEPLPFPPFSWLKNISMELEVLIFTWVGGFGAVLLLEAVMSRTFFHTVYNTPMIITSFGASAVLLFCAIESPLAQPRNFVIGHFVSALIGTCITRLFVLDPSYMTNLEQGGFHANTFVNGGLCMAVSAAVQFVLGIVHPPAGATSLDAAVHAEIVALSWRFLPTVLVSSLLMLGWAMILNNVGRRRYPMHWWASGMTFVVGTEEAHLEELERECRDIVHLAVPLTRGEGQM